MSTHILTIFRQYLSRLFVSVMPIRKKNILNTKHHRLSLHERHDAWLFESTQTVDTCSKEITSQMGRLSGRLTSLRTVISDAAGTLPLAERTTLNRTQGPLWSDTMLFDGEPSSTAYETLSVQDHVDFLFDEPEEANTPKTSVAYSKQRFVYQTEAVSAAA